MSEQFTRLIKKLRTQTTESVMSQYKPNNLKINTNKSKWEYKPTYAISLWAQTKTLQNVDWFEQDLPKIQNQILLVIGNYHLINLAI